MYWRFLSLPVLATLLVTNGKVQAQSGLAPYSQMAAQPGNRLSFLGVNLVDVNGDRVARLKLSEEQGVEVVSVETGTPAESAGIKMGDVLLAYNGETILGTHQFSRLVHETPPGRKVKIQIWRDGKPQTVTAKIGAYSPRIPSIPATMTYFRFSDLRPSGTNTIPGVLMIWNNLTLGIECESLDSQLAQYFGVSRGVLVRAVANNSLASKAGIKAGDVLVSAGNRALESPEDLGRVLRQAGKPVPFSLVRDHKHLALSLTPLSEDQ